MTQTKAIVIGAGLAGLTAARELVARNHDVTLLEARDRIGGRALSMPVGAGGVDLGPAWIWPAVQPHITALIQEMGLHTLPQFEDGAFVYEAQTGIQRGQFPHRYGDAARIRGGVGALARAMAATLPNDTIRLGHAVTRVDLSARPQVTTETGETFDADVIVCAVPPPIAATWAITPDWPQPLRRAMIRWPTWMAAHAKVIATYETPFWREQGMSGSAVSQIGPLVEVADQSDPEMGQYALFGFVGWPVAQRQDTRAVLDAALAQLARLFGPDAVRPVDLRIMDWAAEPFTTTQADQTPPNGHPPYGAPELSAPVNGRLFIAGAEASQSHGGLIEGAIASGKQAAAKAANMAPA